VKSIITNLDETFVLNTLILIKIWINVFLFLVNVQRGSEMCGHSTFNHMVPVSMYSQIRQLSRKVGHLSAVYCVLFDRTGEFMFTVSLYCLFFSTFNTFKFQRFIQKRIHPKNLERIHIFVLELLII